VRVRSWTWIVLGWLTLSCSALRTPALLERVNAPPTEKPPPPVPLEERIARMTYAHLADSYVDPPTVATWLRAVGQHPEAVVVLHDCLVGDSEAAGTNEPSLTHCYSDFPARGVSHAYAPWGLPAAPRKIDPDKDPQTARTELDVERLVANGRALGSTLATLSLIRGEHAPPGALTSGIGRGAETAARYIEARRWHRDLKRHSTAIVMSGGAANGAFSAGFVWRLMEVLALCRGASAAGCPDARIDLAVGTSAGALIGAVLDEWANPERATVAQDLLLDSYTCKVESDLYCVNDEWDWKLAEDLRGVVRFDRVEELIRKNLTRAATQNPMEFVAVSVDLETGDIHAESDQDPQDEGPQGGSTGPSERQVGNVMASIVEPVVAVPVDGLAGVASRVPGTFSDGGLRSNIALLEAVRRGAERVLVLGTGQMDPGPIRRPKNAVDILLRAIDLATSQVPISEVQLGELAAVARRLTEYNVCLERFPGAADQDYCTRRSPRFFPEKVPPTGPEAAVSSFIGPQGFAQVSSSWRTAWVFRPEKEDLATLQFYAFRPEVMRPLFLEGVRTFQRRCFEVLRLLGVEGQVAQGQCALDAEQAVASAEHHFKPELACTADKPRMRTCR
jgi:predicted acylesterase/phospholipase RssA